MNNPLHHFEMLRDNLVKTIADLEIMFRVPVLMIDQSKIPDIDIEVFVEEWKSHSSQPLLLPAGSCEISYTIDEKYQKMIDMYREHLKIVNSEINKYKEPSAAEEFSIPIHFNNPKVSSISLKCGDIDRIRDAYLMERHKQRQSKL